MTTTRAAAPVTPPGSAPAAAPDPGSGSTSYAGRQLASFRRALRSSFEGTPGRLKAVGAITVVATLLFGLMAGFSFRAADGALTRAGANTDQLIRVQAIQNSVVQADAGATNAFLVGGLEPPAGRAEYTRAISSASKLIAEAAQEQPADGPALGALNEALLVYASEIEQARANNRQALPIGAQYLKDASAGLRADALPALTSLVGANGERVDAEFDNARRSVLWLAAFGLLTLAVLGFALVWLARRTRRYVNVPLAAAAAIVLVTLVVGTVGLLGIGSRVDTVQGGAYAATVSTAQARIAGFDAKSNESLGLIARGSGAAFEESWKKSDGVVRAELSELGENPESADLEPLPWEDYAEVHEQIRVLDDSGRWDAAVKLATGAVGSTSNATFASFDETSGEQLSTLGEKTTSQLDDAGGWLTFASVLGLLAGVVAALCAWWGVSLRLEEYR
ncbi:MAG: hypothetical protein ABWX73_11975 [Marmoricola sp.]